MRTRLFIMVILEIAANELYALLDVRVHHLIDINERHYLTVFSHQFLYCGRRLHRAAELKRLSCVEQLNTENTLRVESHAAELRSGICSHGDVVFLTLT